MRLSLFLIFDAEIIHNRFEIVLHQQASISEIPGEFIPFFQAAIIKHLMLVVDDKRDNPIVKAFFEKDQSSDASVAVLKRMDTFKLNVEIQQIVKRLFFFQIILFQEFLNCSGYL